jgi:hypothetical protein
MDINRPPNGDRSTPMLVAILNGQYDIATMLLDRGANPNLTSDDGVAPLFAVLNNEWALRTWYPQPTPGTQQRISYLELMEALLEGGADPKRPHALPYLVRVLQHGTHGRRVRWRDRILARRTRSMSRRCGCSCGTAPIRISRR